MTRTARPLPSSRRHVLTQGVRSAVTRYAAAFGAVALASLPVQAEPAAAQLRKAVVDGAEAALDVERTRSSSVDELGGAPEAARPARSAAELKCLVADWALHDVLGPALTDGRLPELAERIDALDPIRSRKEAQKYATYLELVVKRQVGEREQGRATVGLSNRIDLLHLVDEVIDLLSEVGEKARGRSMSPTDAAALDAAAMRGAIAAVIDAAELTRLNEADLEQAVDALLDEVNA